MRHQQAQQRQGNSVAVELDRLKTTRVELLRRIAAGDNRTETIEALEANNKALGRAFGDRNA